MKKKTTPKYLPPEKRMNRYQDFGYNETNNDLSKVKWTKFAIIVPTEKDKKEIQAAMEYFHDMRETDTGFVTVNQLVHEYDHTPGGYTRIVVDEKLYEKLKIKD